MSEIETHPVQVNRHPHISAECPKIVTMAAYEVYSYLYGPQEALVTGWCRGGFHAPELIAFLYARSFPMKEWRDRVDEALNGMKGF
jgi:hypothetical protein